MIKEQHETAQSILPKEIERAVIKTFEVLHSRATENHKAKFFFYFQQSVANLKERKQQPANQLAKERSHPASPEGVMEFHARKRVAWAMRELLLAWVALRT